MKPHGVQRIPVTIKIVSDVTEQNFVGHTSIGEISAYE